MNLECCLQSGGHFISISMCWRRPQQMYSKVNFFLQAELAPQDDSDSDEDEDDDATTPKKKVPVSVMMTQWALIIHDWSIRIKIRESFEVRVHVLYVRYQRLNVKSAVTPLLTHWTYCTLTLSRRYVLGPHSWLVCVSFPGYGVGKWQRDWGGTGEKIVHSEATHSQTAHHETCGTCHVSSWQKVRGCSMAQFDDSSLLVLRLEYSWIIRRILWLLIWWLLGSPGYQQPWYWWWEMSCFP